MLSIFGNIPVYMLINTFLILYRLKKSTLLKGRSAVIPVSRHVVFGSFAAEAPVPFQGLLALRHRDLMTTLALLHTFSRRRRGNGE